VNLIKNLQKQKTYGKMLDVAEGLSLHCGIWNDDTVQWRDRLASTLLEVIPGSIGNPQQPKQNLTIPPPKVKY
jgi:hypothetical protein